jgi:membrane protease YdiL (CAAX protease family)
MFRAGEEIDALSMAFFTIALLAGMFLYIDAGFIDALFAIILLISGAAGLQLAGQIKKVSYIDTRNDMQSMYYALIAVGAFLAISLGTNLAFLSLTIVKGLSVINSEEFGILMAVAEEFFFRGFLLFWLFRVTRSASAAVMGSAAVFAVYHFAVYGQSAPDLIIVFAAGLLLAFIALRTRSVLPDIMAHVAINLLAFA